MKEERWHSHLLVTIQDESVNTIKCIKAEEPDDNVYAHQLVDTPLPPAWDFVLKYFGYRSNTEGFVEPHLAKSPMVPPIRAPMESLEAFSAPIVAEFEKSRLYWTPLHQTLFAAANALRYVHTVCSDITDRDWFTCGPYACINNERKSIVHLRVYRDRERATLGV